MVPWVKIDTYRGKNVWATMPDWAENPGQDLENLYDVMSGFNVDFADPDVDFAIERLKFKYLFDSRAGIRDVFDFFDTNKGRYQHFWVPTWRRDVIPNVAILASDTSIGIEDVKYDDYWLPNRVDGRHLAFLFPDGEYAYRKILYTTFSGTVLHLDAAIGKACPTTQLSSLIVSFLFLMRFNMDELEMEYITKSVATYEMTFISVGMELTTTTT